MSALGWFERMLNSVADHGMELIGLKERGDHNPSDSELCHRLVDGMGEASNIALAREILQRWQEMSGEQHLAFLQMIAVEFNPDPVEIQLAAQAYQSRDPDSLKRLLKISEPPRQELFRRLNMAPGATAILVTMRSVLLQLLRQQPELKGVDYDMRHLLSSWFNRGFLHLERIDWNTAASILEKLIRYEVVHPMQGWDDLRRRLGHDRRCFAFFHPALPQDPLIFVEVALTKEVSGSVTKLIDPETPLTDTGSVDTAVFYSINNALKGLRGISFGNFLIKQVVNELKEEFPGLQRFVTLSPIPRLRSSLLKLQSSNISNISAEDLDLVLGSRKQQLLELTDCEEPLPALDKLTPGHYDHPENKWLADVLNDLVLFYIVFLKKGYHAYEPVAHFHLSNGARLERINIFANPSQQGMKESWGCMVNYRYEESDLVANHEAYLCNGDIALSSELEQRLNQLKTLLLRS
ncbi:MAG: malonyl-CoA decarboxylase family protein [Candidatus Thiodiazotropha sp. DIVDIV]